MRTVITGWGAALCALAVFAFGAGAYRETAHSRPELVIEVLHDPVQEEETAAAAVIENSPRVLIYHTHTWEAYEMTDTARYTPTETWRTKDDQHNMIRVGKALAGELEALGFSVTHDTSSFEPPNLSDAYSRSLKMLDTRMAAGETYDYIFDVHRDAYSGDWNGGNSVVSDDGTRRAYVMLLIGKGTGTTGAGFDERPDWPKNLTLAEEITQAMNDIEEGIGRSVKIKTGRFNQHVSAGALLIEVGNNRNTLEEALNACPVIARAIAQADAARRMPP